MDIDPTVLRLLGSLGEDRHDETLKRVAADACLDAGLEAWAECLRWAADNRRSPAPIVSDRNGPSLGVYGWLKGTGGIAAFPSDLPDDMPMPPGAPEGVFGKGDAAEAWVRLLERWAVARAAGWVPPRVEGARFVKG